MGLYYGTRSCIVHFLTETQPLTNSILEKAQKQMESIEKLNLSFDIEHRELLLVKSRARLPLLNTGEANDKAHGFNFQ